MGENINEFKARSSERFLANESLRLEIYGKGTGKILGNLKNISQTGANIEIMSSELPLQKGDLIRGTVSLDSIGKTRTFDAEIVWNTKDNIGICFMKKSDLFKKMLAKTLS